MSAHGLKAKRRHPETTTYEREKFIVAHVTFELCDHPKNGVTFALIAGDAIDAKDRRPMFSGHISKGMGSQLRRLAARIDELEVKL